MRHQEVYDALHRTPFEPFRLQLTNGQSYIVDHPDFAWLTRTSVLVGMSSGDDQVPGRFTQCDLLHVVAIEPANGKRRSPRHKGRRGGPA